MQLAITVIYIYNKPTSFYTNLPDSGDSEVTARSSSEAAIQSSYQPHTAGGFTQSLLSFSA